MPLVQATPPRWDLSTVYPGLDSPEFRRAGFAAMRAEIDRFETLARGALDPRGTTERTEQP